MANSEEPKNQHSGSTAFPQGGQSTPEGFVPAEAERRRSWFWPIVNWAVIVVVLWAVRRTLVGAWRELGQAEWRWAPEWLGVAAVAYLAGLIPAGFFWYLTLRRLGQKVPLLPTFRAYLAGTVGKYIPGKFMVIILRTAFLCGEGISPAMGFAGVLYETLTMMSVGAFWGGCFLLWHGRVLGLERVYLLVAAGMFLAATLTTFPPFFRALMKTVLKGVAGMDPVKLSECLSQIKLKLVVAGWLLMSVVWIFWGASLVAVLAASGQVELDWAKDLPTAVAATALATVVGFAAVAVPGGLGVREAALAAILVPVLADRTAHPNLLAIVSAGLLRIIWAVVEVLLFVISAIMTRSGLMSPPQRPASR
ncbi:MAG: flippase-like domain-containing protein [Thermoguttaceae bacterium]|nr:flippase-like domain-containing protein [Thermoguttaceae bacterium]